MKRRNADCGKIRRPIKRNKIAEQFGSNTLLYIKFLLLWAFVITADFLLEFRFEFLWPFWLLLRSVYDSFKYKGLAFSVLFVFIAITSDLVCLFFIPVQWLFFAASTYVWVQYVWHTDKGICLPTIILWILFVYLEAAIRWKDSRNIPHLDLCRPFAAHCIGYPVVTLGFGFKSYVGYRIRQRKQREVAKDNDFYMQLLQEALPKEESATSNVQLASEVNSDQPDHQLAPVSQPKELAVTAVINNSTNCNNLNSSSSSSGGSGSHYNHHHHHNSKNAQTHSKSQSSLLTANQVNGHAGTGSNVTVASGNSGTTSTMNGSANHSKHSHRKSLDKENSGSLSGKANSSYSYHQQQQNNSINYSPKDSSRTSDILQTNGAAMSPKEKKDFDSPGFQKTQFDSLSTTSSQTSGSSNRSPQAINSTHDASGSKSKHQQNGHVINYDMELQQTPISSQQNQVENDPPAEPKTNRAGRKNRVKQKENTNHVAAVRLAATLALASSITTLTTTVAASTVSTTTTTSAGSVTSKDNHLQNLEQQQQSLTTTGNGTASNNTQNGTGSTTAGSTVAGISTTTTSSTTAVATTTAAPTVPDITLVPPVIKVCETCSRLEAEAKKLRSEISSLKQTENETRQSYDFNTNNLKSCLQAKQKDCDELKNKYQDLASQRQQERQSLQTVERRLGEERRHRQSLESQLQNERKHRKQAEDKAARAECGEGCKLKRQQMEMEIQKLRRDLKSSEDAKHNAEKQTHNFEQEMRKFEVQLRNRESQQSAEVLMSALAAMQDKNATLEKNLSAETRVKLDLFSALGDTRRQLEIATCSLRTKDKEILDLKAKIVQLLAVMPAMPNDALCLSGPGPSSSSGGGGSGGNGAVVGSHMRLSDAPQLLSQSGLNGITGQPSPMSHIVMNNPPLISQLSNLGVLTSTITTASAAMSAGCAPANVMSGGGMVPPSMQQTGPGIVTVTATGSNGQIVQMQNSNNCPSNLDPNASVYTPKNCSSMVGGTEA
ncbi:macoilin [Malaya genurostris]|uniref:macoilin n=1 Tax=Malaya genurostris TaxID=325434 RepID=UPI0026F3BAA0|nr:macoilin [Malaya genurostris]